jgi:drug/metabolite transporter (DMT)-like permease
MVHPTLSTAINYFKAREGAILALTAAALFGLSTPAAKILLGSLPPLYMAGLLYLGMGLGLGLWSHFSKNKKNSPPLSRKELPYLVLAVLCGGIIAPICLMFGLAGSEAAGASLLLNLEGVLTAAIAWIVFKENCDRRIVSGMILITIGGIILSWGNPSDNPLNLSLLHLIFNHKVNLAFEFNPYSLLIVLACLGWALDNNFTRQIAFADARQLGIIKGLVAGVVNMTLAATTQKLALTGAAALTLILPALLLGFIAYGLSLVLYVHSLRFLGAARTGAYFSTAPFLGAALSLAIFHERLTLAFILSAAAMAAGVYLHLSEQHQHEHKHEAEEHEHEHEHGADTHHEHSHVPGDPPGPRHSHKHKHDQLKHSHAHFPDSHHRHQH